MAVAGLCCHAWALVVVCRLFIAVPSLAVKHGLWDMWAPVVAAHRPPSSGSVVAVHGLSCPIACGIFMDGPRIEPMSPILAGEFLTTGSPGKSQRFFLSMIHQEAELKSGTVALL